MTGLTTDYDPRTGVSLWFRGRATLMSRVSGGYFFGAAPAPGVLTFVAPANCTYRFSFSPYAMEAAPGTLTICTH
jgi:hypothetical protein